MRWTTPALLLFCLAAIITPATAGTAPQATTDFEADWDVEGGGPIRLHYSASLHTMRMEISGPAGRAIMLKNLETGEAFNWSPDDPNFVMRMHGERGIDRTAEKTSETKTVGGEDCTVWRAPEGDACFTPDGIWVETRGPDNNSTVRNLKRTSQPETLFKPPASAQIMDMPANMGPPGGMNGRPPGSIAPH